MAAPFTLCVGTQNEGVWVSADGGTGWLRSALELPDYARAGEVDVRAVAFSPHDAHTVWAGSTGEPGTAELLRSEDAGRSFARVAAPLHGVEVWSLAPSPHDPNVLLVGTRPAGVLRTSDGGASWTTLALDAPQTCNAGSTRVTDIAWDPVDPDSIWLSIEIGGVLHSADAGETWTDVRLSGGQALLGPDETWRDDRHFDIHGIEVSAAGGGAAVVCVSTPIGFFRTADRGATWSAARFPADPGAGGRIWYTRGLHTPQHAAGTVFAGVGDYIPGDRGQIYRSDDDARTWRPVGPATNSVVYALAGDPRCPAVLAACSVYGQILTSADGGENWACSPRAFGETRAIAVAPGE